MTETALIRALLNSPGIGIGQALKLYRHYGSAAAIFENVKDLPITQRQNLNLSADTIRQAEEEDHFCERHHIQQLTYNSAAYPQRLRECADAPLLLYYKGTADLNAKHMVAVVGTRKITERGKDLTQKFCKELAQLVPDAIIVSGLAYGVDIHAHRASLDASLSTIGVLAHGLDRIYPAYHRPVAAKMTEQGGLLTEYTTGTSPHAGNFVSRNRIVAGLCDAVVVVESAEKGGSLITARLAQEYNRDVFAFPGRVGDEYSKGCNKLIKRNCAALITEARDLTEAMLWTTEQPAAGTIQPTLFPNLSDDETKIIENLADEKQKTISELSQDCEFAFSKTLQTLLSLELKGIVKGLPGGIYRLLV